MAINGRLYDWEDCEIVMPGGLVNGLTELNYKDGQAKEARYGRGAVPRGWGRKNYEASGDMTLDRDQFEIVSKTLALGNRRGTIYDHEPFTIICSYANDGMPVIVDKLPDVVITEIDTGHKQGEANDGQMKISFIVLSPIIWNGIPAKKG